MSNYCVTSTPTICDGTVLRWYSSEEALIYGNCAISASRNGVVGHGGQITPPMFQAAWDAHLLLKARRDEDANRAVTHRRKRVFGTDYERISPAEAE